MRLLPLIFTAVLLGAPGIYSELPSGRYAVKVEGMLTTTCALAIEREVARLPQVESAAVDFEAESMTLTVRIDQTLPVSSLSRALRRAAKKVDLGARYLVGDIAYQP
ncbi:MAG: heavy metal-associated domain-containing protein [Elusimicrobia bacterium]|nr:heavy metal-associated domain-containing protein [Elusimicrobiota bacterium]